MKQLGDELVLSGVSTASLPLEQVIPAAAAAGFDGISVLDRSYRRAVTRAGMTSGDLRQMIADNGLFVSEVEATGDWLSPPPTHKQDWLNQVYDLAAFLDICAGLSARTLVAVHFGKPEPPQVAAEAFARLCDVGAERGLRIQLEFPAMATVNDIRSAWEIVRLADRDNGGLMLDVWHHRRGRGSDDDVFLVPPERIFGIQVSDGASKPVGTLLEDLQRRVLPGQGELGVANLLAKLDRRGVRCPVGIEVLSPEIVAGGAESAASVLYSALTGAVCAARSAAI